MSLSEREKSLLCLAAIAAAALLAFSPCLFNDFLFMDDPQLVWQNLIIRDLSPAGLARLFFHPPADLYMPLVFLTYAIEYHFFGVEPMAYHATNILLHALNAGLVFLFLRPFFKSLWPVFAAALIFTVHPLNVETVAWVSQRKDVLFFFFAALSLALHTRRARTGHGKDDAPALIAFALALLSKPMAVTLPALFVLTDVCLFKQGWRASLRSKALFFLLAGVFSVWTVMVFVEGGHIRPVAAGWWSNMPFYGLVQYFSKMALPLRLAAVFSVPRQRRSFASRGAFYCGRVRRFAALPEKSSPCFFRPGFFCDRAFAGAPTDPGGTHAGRRPVCVSALDRVVFYFCGGRRVHGVEKPRRPASRSCGNSCGFREFYESHV